MQNEVCLGVKDDSKFSSPMPIIGVYIMTSTLVCLVFFICDVFQGYRHNKPWLPCRFFSLNSLTLTLLGIATKLPVDLTTAMPSSQDQLSKLCGTVLVCISMGFFMPSLGEMEGFELFGNMASVTVLVVTVIVNICIQISTGVIFTFYLVEHVIALSLLLLMLIAMWYITFLNTYIAGINNDLRSNSLKTTYSEKEDEVIRGLRDKYQATYQINPQLVVCLFTDYVAYVVMLSTLSLVVIFVAFFRTFLIKHIQFCEGESDYKWSMWMLVVGQVATSVVGTVAIILRSVFFARHNKSVKASSMEIQRFRLFAKIASNWRIVKLPVYSSRIGIERILQVLEELVICILFVTHTMMGWTDFVITQSIQSARKAAARVGVGKNNDDGQSVHAIQYLEQSAIEHINEWIERCEKDHPVHLNQLLLSKTKISQEPRWHHRQCNHFLVLVLLVRIAVVSIPWNLSRPLMHALDEIFEILYFIEGKRQIPSTSMMDQLRSKLTKELWMHRDMDGHWFQKVVIKSLQKNSNNVLESQHDLDCAVRIIQEFTKLLDDLPVGDVIKEESLFIKNLIQKGTVDSIEDLCERINQQFVNILYVFLPQLPGMISEYVSQSPIREHEKRLRIALKFMCKLKHLKPYGDWLTPEVDNQRMEGVSQSHVAASTAKDDDMEEVDPVGSNENIQV